MISRRQLLEAGGLGALAALSPLAASGLSQNEKPDESSLPPSLAQLKSRRAEATPITRQERSGRLERARQLMSENAIDAMVLMSGTSLNYFTGIRWWGGERMFAFVLPAKRSAFYVCPAFEEDRAREQIANAPDGEHPDVRTWQEDESPYHLVARGLKDDGVATGKLGIEETVRFFFADGIAKAAPQLTLTSATPITAGCRMIKSAHEIALMRLAAQVTLTAYEAVYHALREGMTQQQVEALIAAAYGQLGFPGEASVEVDEFTAYPHGSSVPQVIREGSIVMIDDGCTVEGLRHCAGKYCGQNEEGVRHRTPGAGRGSRDGAPGRRMRRSRCGGSKSNQRWRLWTRLQILCPSPGPWHGHGRTRMALSGARRHHQACREHDDQQRAGHLHSRRIRHSPRR
jgi:Xaa-Pro dipeptidase